MHTTLFGIVSNFLIIGMFDMIDITT